MTSIKFVWSNEISVKDSSIWTVRSALHTSLPQMQQWAQPEPYPDARKTDVGYELLSAADFAVAHANEERKLLYKYVEEYLADHLSGSRVKHRIAMDPFNGVQQIYFIIREYGIHIKRRHEIGFFINAENA